MEKIRNYLLHLLGGVDKKALLDINRLSIAAAWADAKKYADSLYGLTADEWSNSMYNYIKTRYERTRQ